MKQTMKQTQAAVSRRAPGQGTVEFALVVPIFLLLLLGVVEFSWALYTHTTLMHAAEEGVRRGIVMTKTPGAWETSGNQSGTYAGLLPCNSSTIVGTVACGIAVLDTGRTTAILDTPPGSPAIRDYKVEVRLNHTYRGLILGFFPGMNGIVMTGNAEGYTQ